MSEPYRLQDCISALEPIPDGRSKSLRELSRHIRWEKGWQGVGALSYRNLKHTVGGDSMSQTFRAIDGNNPPQSLRQAYDRLGFPLGGGITRLPDEPISLRQIARRTVAPDVVSLRWLSYNTYLLPGFQIPFGRWIDDSVGWDALSWFGIPFGGSLLVILGLTSLPGLAVATILKLAGFAPSKVIQQITGLDLNSVVSIGAKPALEARASEMGAVFSEYDVCCLCEVFTNDSRDRIFSDLANGAWRAAAGPDESGSFTFLGSGLFFLERNRPIVQTERMIFADRGNRRKDSDAWSNKGAMLNVIDLGFGQLEVFQTHLYYGGGLPEVPILTEQPSYDERMNVWRAELAELAEFYRQHHQPQNVAVLTGDFNMSGVNVREYAELRRMIDSLNLHDLWAWDIYRHHPSEGLTCRFTDGDESGWKRDFADECASLTQPDCQGRRCEYCDDRPFMPPPVSGVGRYDFIFVERPIPSHRYNLEVSSVLRRPFPRQTVTESEAFLSDHLGLELMLIASPR